jgi:hydroxymethylpyrimidine pyrophosphatase-like HAD family hydrolase
VSADPADPETPVRVVATDLDGTLLSPAGAVTARAAAAVARARAAGIDVIPATGRPPHALGTLASDAGLGPFAICSNGAVVVDLDAGRILEVDRIPGGLAGSLVRRARLAAPGVRFAVDRLDGFSHETDFFDQPVVWDGAISAVADLAATLECGCIKLIARLPGKPAADLIARLHPTLGSDAHLTTSGLDWVDIGMPGVTKATALARICRRIGVHASAVVAVGDNHNDLSMLAWAGTSVAVANAVPEVLACAGHVVPANADDGVAVLLEDLVAGRCARS